MVQSRICLVLSFGLSLVATADDSAWRRMQESKEQVTAYLHRAARVETDRAVEEIRSVETWERVRPRRLEEMRDMLGLLPWPKQTPLYVQKTGVLDQGDYVIEKIAFQSMPKIYVTGNLYLPKRRSGPLPAIVYVCGHAFSPHGNKSKYQRHGISFAKNGYVAFILDSIQIAETFGLHHGVSSQEMYEWYARGYTPAGVEVWNAIRALDYLETRPEVDKNRIGITGRSGGAAMSWFTAAVEPRIKAAVPVMGISTYAANVLENTQRRHCDCMFLVNSYLHDMIHQGALIAPRPLLMMHGRKDLLFPVAGYEEFEEKVGNLYRAYKRGQDFQNIVVETGHEDSDYLREQAIRWFDRHLMKTPDRELNMEYSDVTEQSLAVFRGRPPADAQNFRVHETFTARPSLSRFPNLDAWKSRRRQLLTLLRGKVFRALPARFGDLRVQKSPLEKGAPFQEMQFSPEEGIQVDGLLRKPSKLPGPVPGLLYVASDAEDPRAIQALLRGVNRRNSSVRLAVYPRGVGEVPWEKSFWKSTLRNAMHVGHTVDSMRLVDVLAAVEVLRNEEGVDPERIMVLGKGVSGALGLYAAILDPGIHQVMLIDPPTTHVSGSIFLNVLRYTDLPEAAALIAPRHLNFYARMPAAYEYTRHVYALYGKPDRVFLAMNIEAVLEGRYDHNFASGR